MRLFLAAVPPAAALADLAAALAPVRSLPGGPRWGDPAHWHVTVTFLGEVPDTRLDHLVAALGPAAVPCPPVRLHLTGAGTFPTRGSPRVLWTGLSDARDGGAGVAEVARASVALGRAARLVGVPVEERPFRPHLTLGRWRPADVAGRAVVDALAGYRGPAFTIGELVLMRSRLGPVPRYDRMQAWELGGAS